jgi:hypothetical protein
MEAWPEGIFQLCWQQHGGSGLAATLDEVLELPTTDRVFGSTTATQQNGSAWTALGNVVAFVLGCILSTIGVLVSVISAAVSIIWAAIHIVMAVFSGLADLMKRSSGSCPNCSRCGRVNRPSLAGPAETAGPGRGSCPGFHPPGCPQRGMGNY